METCLNLWALLTFNVLLMLFPIQRNQSPQHCRICSFSYWHQHPFPPLAESLWHILVMCISCSLWLSAALEGWALLIISLCFVVWDHWDEHHLWWLSLPSFHVLFACTSLLLFRAGEHCPACWQLLRDCFVLWTNCIAGLCLHPSRLLIIQIN